MASLILYRIEAHHTFNSFSYTSLPNLTIQVFNRCLLVYWTPPQLCARVFNISFLELNFFVTATKSTNCQMNPYNAQNSSSTKEMAIHQTNIEHTPGSPLPSNDHHAPHIASVVETPHTQSPDADDNPQLALDPAVDTPEHDTSSNFSVDPSAASSFGLDNPRRPVINVNEQFAPSLAESLQSQQVPDQPNS